MRLTLSLTALMMLCTTAGQAQIMLSTGAGPGHECYLVAKFGYSNDSVKSCDLALEQPMNLKDRAATYNNRGIVLSRLARLSQAREDFATAMRLQPDLGDAYINYGSILIREKRYAEAIAQTNKGLGLPSVAPYIGYYNRAVAQQLMGQLREAYYDYSKALELEPNFGLASERLKDFVVQRTPARSSGNTTN